MGLDIGRSKSAFLSLDAICFIKESLGSCLSGSKLIRVHRNVSISNIRLSVHLFILIVSAVIFSFFFPLSLFIFDWQLGGASLFH